MGSCIVSGVNGKPSFCIVKMKERRKGLVLQTAHLNVCASFRKDKSLIYLQKMAKVQNTLPLIYMSLLCYASFLKASRHM